MSKEDASVLRRRLTNVNPSLSASSSHVRSQSVESVKEASYSKQSSRWTPLTRGLLAFFAFSTLVLRLYRISEPREVVFDEVHFGGFASHYLKGTYFFDVHPPLGKLLIAGLGHLYGYKGTFAFKDIGDAYSEDPTVPFVQLRTAMVAFGTGSVMFALATLVEMGFSPLSLVLAGFFMAFDNALVVQTRFILLDAMMFFFIFGSVFCWTKFRQLRYNSFSLRWWSYLVATGIFLAGTVGIKLVGLFTVALVGFACLYDLWELADWRRQMPDSTLWKHFYARFVALTVMPVMLYLSFYYIHFKMLPYSGPGDKHMSTSFQQTLLGNKMHADSRSIYYGQTIRIQSRSERIFLHSHVHKIPLNHLDGKVSSEGQQVNGYPVEDENNWWQILKVEPEEAIKPEESNVEENAETEVKEAEDEAKKSVSEEERVQVKYGDAVKICHKATGHCLMTHDVASALTRTNMEITMLGTTKTTSDTPKMAIWLVEPVSESETSKPGMPIRSFSSHFHLVNKHFKVRLMNFSKNLPPWGFGQREMNGCRKKVKDARYEWMIADVLDARTAEEESERVALQKTIKPMSFLLKFWELQWYSIAANSGLIDEHPYKSRPQEWLLPFKGLGFWNKSTSGRIFLLGNLVGWTVASLGIFVFSIRFPKDKFREHRGLIKFNDHFHRRFGHKMAYLFGGYLLHYLPFYIMGRSLYLHHYLPAFMFSVMITAAQFDCMSRNWHPRVRMAIVAALVIGVLAFFVYLLPLIYGTPIEAEVLTKRKFIKAWNF